MIYVLKSLGYGSDDKPIELIKIGFTDDWNKRLNHYKLHNPTIKVLFLYEDGNEVDEKSLHYYFKELSSNSYGREWFYYDEKIIDFFNSNNTLDKVRDHIPIVDLKSKKMKLKKKGLFRLYIDSFVEIMYTKEDIIKNPNIRYDIESQVLESNIGCDMDELKKWFRLNYSNSPFSDIDKLYEEKLIEFEKYPEEVQKFMQVYESLPRLYDKLKYLCEYECDGRIKSSILEHITEKHFKEYYLTLGPEKLKTLGYGITQINKYLGIITFDATELNKEILSSFNVGDKLTVSEVKEKLANIYIKTGYEKTPTSKDLEEWFELKKIVINTKIESGKYKRDRGFEILAKK